MLNKIIIYIIFILAFGLFTYFVLAQSNSKTENTAVNVWKGHEKSVNSIAFTPSGKFVVSGSLDGTVRVWEAKTGNVTHVIKDHTNEVYSVSISSNEKWIASGGFDGKVIISSLSDGKRYKEFNDFSGWCLAVAFSPDSQELAAATTDGKITIWETETGKKLQTLTAKSWQMAIAWSPDKKFLVSGSINLTVWDIKTGQSVKTLEGHSYTVNSITFSADGKTLLTSSLDKTGRLWNLETGAAITIFEPKGFARTYKGRRIIDRMSVPMLAAVFSPDGKYTATAGADRIITLWDSATGKQLNQMFGHEMSITDLKFSPDGKQLISSSLDQTIRVWDVDYSK